MIIKFMTFNIQHGKNYITKNIELDKVIEVIEKENPDIIGLNEVYNIPNQTKEIATKLGYNYFYFSESIIHNNIPYGNALLSKYEFNTIEKINIPDPLKDTDEYYESRTIIKATFKSFDFVLYSTHIGLAQKEKINAINLLLNMIDNSKQKIVLIGDFNLNDYTNNPLILEIEKRLTNAKICFKEKQLSYPSINPEIKVDYIFSNLHIVNAYILEEIVSDHYPHIAYIEIK